MVLHSDLMAARADMKPMSLIRSSNFTCKEFGEMSYHVNVMKSEML